MEYTFKDRPTSERILKAMKNRSEIDPSLVLTFLNLQWTYRDLEKEYGRLLEKYRLSESSFIVMMLLFHSDNEPLSPSLVAEKLGSTRATASKLIKRMEKDHLVLKIASEKDKRSASVQLSTEGRQVLEAFLPYNFLLVEKIFSSFSADELNVLNTLLHKLSDGTKKLKMEEII
ncbi:MarR family winged helix-turn-helix transcriptional regulator [Desulfitobacterium sp. Sab5]|uniref:MarR family winged helix-turn-helix transcriptional regulator n=1 Tax=Desulfitobacterium nosdiversum TaxID=3375356 RepID=UPI003CEEF27D